MTAYNPPSRLDVRSRLKARLPVLVAPMFLVTNTAMITSACRAGVIGILPALNARTDEIFEAWVREITEDLEKARKGGVECAAWGVNLVLRNNPRLETQLRIVERYKVPVVVTIMGRVAAACNVVHGYGGLVFHDVTNVQHARLAVSDGVDGLIAVCAGAGGHAGPTSAIALIPALRANFPDVLVIAGGAISDGAAIRAVQTLGADLAYLGTRFIATKESGAAEGYKAMLVASKTGPSPTFLPTVYTDKVSGLPANFLRTSMQQNGMNPDDPNQPRAEPGMAWKSIWSGGHGVLNIHDVPTTAQLVDRLEMEYKGAVEDEGKRMGQWVSKM